MNGHKHDIEEDFVHPAIQERYDAMIDSIDFLLLIDSLKQTTGLDITDFVPPEDVTLLYLVDPSEENDFMWQISLDGH